MEAQVEIEQMLDKMIQHITKCAVNVIILV